MKIGYKEESRNLLAVELSSAREDEQKRRSSSVELCKGICEEKT
jgi:hypothetical protein